VTGLVKKGKSLSKKEGHVIRGVGKEKKAGPKKGEREAFLRTRKKRNSALYVSRRRRSRPSVARKGRHPRSEQKCGLVVRGV